MESLSGAIWWLILPCLRAGGEDLLPQEGPRLLGEARPCPGSPTARPGCSGVLIPQSRWEGRETWPGLWPRRRVSLRSPPGVCPEMEKLRQWRE